MRTSFWFLGVVAVIGASLSLKFQLASASADQITSDSSTTSSIVLDVQTAIASSSDASASDSPAPATNERESAPASTPTPVHVTAAPVEPAQKQAPAPVSVKTAVTERTPTPVQTAAAPANDFKPTMGTSAQYPVRLVIPSIAMNVPIIPVGLNSKGEMDVPSGTSTNVGWYKNGTLPGNVGSAVLDAHVFAAFQDLKNVKIGSSIYVQTAGATKLRFKVVDSRIYTLNELTSDMLFGRHDARRLNLITCAGTYVPSIDTYDHRLVVYAIFQEEELD